MTNFIKLIFLASLIFIGTYACTASKPEIRVPTYISMENNRQAVYTMIHKEVKEFITEDIKSNVTDVAKVNFIYLEPFIGQTASHITAKAIVELSNKEDKCLAIFMDFSMIRKSPGKYEVINRQIRAPEKDAMEAMKLCQIAPAAQTLPSSILKLK